MHSSHDEMMCLREYDNFMTCNLKYSMSMYSSMQSQVFNLKYS